MTGIAQHACPAGGAALTDAQALLDSGSLEDAAAACRTALANNVADPAALRLLGMILLRQGAAAEAVPLLSAAAEHCPDAAVFNELGDALRAIGLADEAANRYRAAIAQQPDSPVAYSKLAGLLAERHAGTEAMASLNGLATMPPLAPETWFALGSALAGFRQIQEAEACYRAAITLRPDYAEALNNLGNLLLERREAEQAAAAYRSAVAFRPDLPGLWLGLGNASITCDRPSEAEDCYRKAIALHPDFVEAHNGLGNALLARHRAAEALAAYRAALAYRPDDPMLQLGIGNAFLDAGEAAAAEQEFRAALAGRPHFVEAAQSLGAALVAQLRPEAAIDAYQAALRMDPANLELRLDYALALLLGGKFTEGWRQHEARRALPSKRQDYERRPELPRWQAGMPLQGRRVLVMMEQGFGDQIQFLRYVPLLAARGVCVTVEVPRPLQPVLPVLFHAARVIAPEDRVSGCDIVCPLMSLPLYFADTLAAIPAAVPYATAPPDRIAAWRAWLGPSPHRRIGIVCSGRPTFKGDHLRSIPLAALAPLHRVAGCDFVLVQPDVRERDQAALAEWQRLRWPGEALRDFGDTAALLAELDLLIAVDTGAAHLAGAMGRAAWLLLPHVPDWRWLLHRRDSPWYPTITLYRQPSHGAWDAVIETVRQDLARWRMTA